MSFLQNFMTWNEGTEVSENYFFWSGVSALAACVNGRVWIHQGKFTHFPNMYIVLLGPAGNGKTVAIDKAEEIVREVGDITMSGQSETAEGLVRFMRDKCVRSFDHGGEAIVYTPLSLYLSELSNFFGKDPAGMIDLITGIWDRGGRQFHRRTKGQGEDLLMRPNVNLLGGTTPAWISQYLKADIVGGGFTRRVVFDNEPRRDPKIRVAWPEDTPAKKEARSNCIAYGKVLATLKGEMQYTHEAKKEYLLWYETRPPAKTEEEEGYYFSKPALMLKVATLCALSREPKLIVDKTDVEVSLALLAKAEVNRASIFNAVGTNLLNAIAQRALDMINTTMEQGFLDGTTKKIGKMVAEKHLRNTLYKDAPHGLRDVDDIVKHLIASEQVIPYDRKHPKSGALVRYLILPSSVRMADGTGEGKEDVT